MGREVPVSTRAMFRTAMLVAAALVLVACGGDGTSQSTEDSTESSSAATGVQSQSMDPCSSPLPTDGFDVGAAAGIPTLDADGNASTLGSEEAAAILDELIVPEDSMCALEVSPGVQEAINAVRAAAGQGDRTEVRRLLEQLIRDVQAAASPIKSLRYSYAPEDRQKTRDAVAAAAEAQAQGEDDLADEAMDQARDHYTNYAETAIAETDDVKALLTIAAEAQLLGLDDIASDAIEKATEILEKELEEIAGRYDPCAPTREEFRELATATARVQLIGGDSTDGDLLINETIDITIRRANDEPVPECDAERWSLAMTMEVDTGEGDVTFLWDGIFTVTDGEIDGDGIGTLLGSGECVVNDVTEEVFDVTGTFTFMVTGTQVLTGTEERLTLRVNSTEAEVQLDAEGSTCAGLAEIARAFLGSVPTFPALYYPEGFDIQVADGRGTSDVNIEPYLLDVTVARLGE